jgi:GDP-mannose 6-dehydrogenase
VQDFLEAPRIVIGTQESDVADLRALLSYNENSPVVLTDTRTAEFVKYVDNAWHALKCTFANEVYHLGAKLGVDVPVANEIFFMDHTLNISTNYLKPGLPFGGSCLPKDLRAIGRLASQQQVDAPMLLNTLSSNKRFQQRLADTVTATGKRRVALVGLTFKNHTDDVRESPMLFLAKDLIAAGAELQIWDEDINLTTLRIEHAGMVRHVSDDLAGAVQAAEVIVVCKRYMALVAPLARKGQLIFNYADHKEYETAAEVRWLYR